MTRLLPFLVLLSSASASVAVAKPPAAPAPPAVATTAEAATVEELNVTASSACVTPAPDLGAPHPRVVSTFPANGAVIRPGVLVLRVTFDQPMACAGFFTSARRQHSPCPTEHQKWTLSFDRRTIRTVCRAEIGEAYGVALSGEVESTFMSLSDKALAPYRLEFSVSAGPALETVSEALAEDTEMFVPPSPYQPIPVQAFGGRK